MRLGRKLLLSVAFGLLPGVTQAQTPSPAQLGLVVATPNVVQVLDSSKNWATIGTVDVTTHVFTVSGSAGIPEAPTGSGVLYGRKNSVWSTVAHTDITDWAATLTPYALLASPAFTGTPSLPTGTTGVTQSPGDSSTKLATTAFVSAATSGGGTITANSTPTSGFTTGQLLMSDGTKTQPASNIAVERNGTSANVIRVYNTYTDASNGEWGGIDWQTSSNLMRVGTSANGTGTTRTVLIGAGGDWMTFDPNGFVIIQAPYFYAQNNGQNLGASWSYWGAVYSDSFVTSGVTGVSCTAGQVSVSTNGIVTACGAAGTPSFPQTVAGTVNSGGIPYFNSATSMSSSAALTANALMIGKGAGVAPTTTTTGANVLTGLGISPGTTGSFALQSGAITTGNLVKWSGATGVSDAGVAPSTSGIISNGTQPTITGSGGTCATTTKVGGATAGTVVLSAVCATTNTIAWTGLPTAPNGWACDAVDRTTRTAGPFIESASTTTGFTLTVGATSSVAADVLQWKCQGY